MSMAPVMTWADGQDSNAGAADVLPYPPALANERALAFPREGVMSSLNRLVVVVACVAWAATARPESPVRWEKLTLTDKYYCDGVTVADINKDGKPDVVAGPFWFEGPEFKTAHPFYPPVVLPTETTPSDSMFSFVY